MRRSMLLLLSSFCVISNTVFAQPGPQWFGTWKSQDDGSSMTISASRMDFVRVRWDEKGHPETFNLIQRWTNRSNDAVGELEDVFGYSKKRVSPSDVSKRYEDALRLYRKDPVDFSVSDPDKSRRAIRTMAPGIYKVLWGYGGGDCGYSEYIIDGDRILEVSECKSHYDLRLFDRVR